MPFRRDHIISAQSEVLPLSEESYLIDLKEAENNLLHFSLTGLPVLDESTEEATDIINSCKVPLLTRIYENLIGVRPIIPRPVITNDSLGDKPSAVPQISLLEVGQHDSFADCWIVIYDRVYDITDFLHSVSENRTTKSQPVALQHLFPSPPPLLPLVAPGRLRRDNGARRPRCHVRLPWIRSQSRRRKDAEEVRDWNSADGGASLPPRNAHIPVG